MTIESNDAELVRQIGSGIDREAEGELFRRMAPSLPGHLPPSNALIAGGAASLGSVRSSAWASPGQNFGLLIRVCR